MFVKICGVTTAADIQAAAEAGADAVGIVFGPSVRQVDPDTARWLVTSVPDHVVAVGVFGRVAATEIGPLAAHAGVDVIQLHGAYPRSAFRRLLDPGRPLWRATSLADRPDLRVGAYGEELLLLDAPVAGAGRTWDLTELEQAPPRGRWMLAGGLTPERVGAAIAQARPWGVDVSSGVESRPGVKDHARIRDFVACARAVVNR